MTLPLVSVLMTAYNREKYIGDAIESVLASTLTDFELIIVDDGSKDKTVEIAKQYETKDSRIKVFVNEKNLGDYPNRNKAASYATGKYLKYLDSDDIIYPYGLEVFVNSMEKFPDAAVGISSAISFDNIPFPFRLSVKEAYEYNFYKERLFELGPSGLIFNTAKFREIGGFSGKRYIGDEEINLRMAARWPVIVLPPALIFWRQHEGQEFVAGVNSTGYLELHLPMYEEELNKSICPLSADKRSAIIKYHRKITARAILRIVILKKNPRLAMKLYKQLGLVLFDIKNAIFSPNKRY